MRHLISMLMSCLVLLLAGCTSGFLHDPVSASGEVIISLGQDTGEEVVTRTGKALPEVNDFEVEIYDAEGNRRYRDTYGNSAGKAISLNAGTHRLLAQYGDSTGVGFNSIYYAADQNFEVEGQTVTEIHAVARMAKVKVSVSFGASITEVYQDWYAKVNFEDGRSLQFSKNDSRAGYFPSGTLSLEVYVQDAGKWKFFAAEPLACSAGEHVTFTLNTTASNGTVVAKVTVDDSVGIIEKQIEVPQTMAPQDAPLLNVSGFDTAEKLVYGGDAFPGKLRADIVAAGRLANCFLEITSSVLPDMPGKTDLASIQPEMAAVLDKMGISFMKGMKGQRLAYVDFSGFPEYLSTALAYEPDKVKDLQFKLTVVDSRGKETSSPFYSFVSAKAESDFSLKETDFWTRHIDIPAYRAIAGNPQKFFIQYKKSGDPEFITIAPSAVDGNLLSYQLSGLQPGTEYVVRNIYNGNEYLASKEYVFSTEAELQVGNAGFEDWTQELFEFKDWFSKQTQVWFRPWADANDSWWTVNSRRTMIAACAPGYLTYKVFPTVSHTSAVSASGKAAQVASVGFGAAATSGTAIDGVYPGEMWIGQDDGAGVHYRDGHAFASRPLKVSYWKKNEPYGGESSSFLLEVRDAEGLVIGKAETTDASTDTQGQTVTLDINYLDLNKKAASIYICIKSSTAGKPQVRGASIEMAGITYNANLGSKILIDDIQLHY